MIQPARSPTSPVRVPAALASGGKNQERIGAVGVIWINDFGPEQRRRLGGHGQPTVAFPAFRKLCFDIILPAPRRTMMKMSPPGNPQRNPHRCRNPLGRPGPVYFGLPLSPPRPGLLSARLSSRSLRFTMTRRGLCPSQNSVRIFCHDA